MELDFSNDMIERLLFKRMLSDKNWLNILSKIFDKRWFNTPNLDVAFEVVLKYYNKYNSVPNNHIICALMKKYDEKYPGVINLTEFNNLINDIFRTNYNIDENVVAINLKEFIRKNAFRFALGDNINLISNNNFNENYAEVVDKCLENFDRVQKITFNDSDLGLNYFNEEDMKKHWEYINNPEAKIKTGWNTLDNYTNGGFLKDGRMLAIIMGQAGLGKSLFLSNLSVNFLRSNLNVVVISLEMSEDVYAQRFDAHISGENVNKLREVQMTAIERIKNFYKEHPEANLYIKEYPPRSIRTQDIDLYLENLKAAGHHFDVIVVDYLNLVLPNHKEDNMYKAVLTVSEELRALSYKFNVPILTATQCNGEGMNNENIDMQHASESKGMAHTADFFGALFQKQEDKENGMISMRILKNRLGGRVGSILNFKMNPETLVLSDITFDSTINDCSVASDELNKFMKNTASLSADINSDIDSF